MSFNFACKILFLWVDQSVTSELEAIWTPKPQACPCATKGHHQVEMVNVRSRRRSSRRHKSSVWASDLGHLLLLPPFPSSYSMPNKEFSMTSWWRRNTLDLVNQWVFMIGWWQLEVDHVCLRLHLGVRKGTLQVGGTSDILGTVKRSWLPRVGVGGKDTQTEHRGYLGQWNCFIWHYNGGSTSYTFVQARRMHSTKSEP